MRLGGEEIAVISRGDNTGLQHLGRAIGRVHVRIKLVIPGSRQDSFNRETAIGFRRWMYVIEIAHVLAYDKQVKQLGMRGGELSDLFAGVRFVKGESEFNLLARSYRGGVGFDLDVIFAENRWIRWHQRHSALGALARSF